MPNLARLDAANLRNTQPDAVQTPNGDESYPDFRGNFSKGLPHDNLGEVDPAEYVKFKTIFSDALAGNTDIQNKLEALTMGAPPASRRKFVNPQGGLSVEMEGADPRKLSQPAAPKFDSAEIAAEITENYWMALLRDVAFESYDTSALADDAAVEMTSFSSEFKGPNDTNGKVTPRALFRGLTPGDLAGPYISQFLFLPVPFGALGFLQRMKTPVANQDFMTDFNEWLNIQKGFQPSQSLSFDNTARYIRNGRDLSQWVHIDVLFEAYFNAALILLQGPNANSPASDPAPFPVTPGLGAPLSQANPYRLLNNQEGFGTFG
ncbi:MAG: phosphoesterase, partial [Acidobacteriota bacterium]